MIPPKPVDQLCSNEDLNKWWRAAIQEAVRASYQEYKVLEACKRRQVELFDLVATRERKAAAHASLRAAASAIRRLRESDVT